MSTRHDRMTDANYECVHEQKLQDHETRIENLSVRIDYKEEKINTIIRNNERMEKKIDKLTESIYQLQLESAQDDFNIDNRVTSLETTISNMEKAVIITPTIISVIITVISFLLMNFRG